MNDGSSTGFAASSEPGATRPRHVPVGVRVRWDLLSSGFVLLLVTYHATYVAPVYRRLCRADERDANTDGIPDVYQHGT